MRRKLAELDRLDTLGQSLVAQPPPRRRASGPQRALSLGVAAALVGAGAFVYDDWWAMAGPLITGRPPEVRTVSTTPLGVPPTQTSTSTDYAFMATRPGFGDEPVTFSPCKVIHVVVNSAQAPPGADGLLREALTRVSAASGLVFTVEGETTEPPTKDRGARDVARYGDRWSPVLVAWTDPSVVPELKGNIAGIGGPVPGTRSISSSQRWVSGIVYLDGPAMSSIVRRPYKGWAQARAIVQHELAHLVGLTHVESRAELMNAKNDSGMLDFGPGDLEGLRRLGSGTC
jgi:hypothetical protein